MPLSTKTLGPFTFAIDRPKGTVKEWPQPTGGVKRFVYPVDYGFLRRHTGEDGEGLDFFVGDDPKGHLESFQKLKRGEDGRLRLDETKFLVGVNDRDRETIYELYNTEVWHRKVYSTWAELARDLPKFRARKKSRYGVLKTAGVPSMDMYDPMMLEKQAVSWSGAMNHVSDLWHSIRGGAGHMMPLSARKTQPWRRPLGRPPAGMTSTQVGSLPTMQAVSGVQPRQPAPAPSPGPVSGVRPKAYTPTQAVPTQQPLRSLMEHSAEPNYHPGQKGISEWLEQLDGPEAVRDDVWTHPGGWKAQGALMPANPGMRQSILAQPGLWDTDRSIMAELGRQFEQRHAQNPAEAKVYLQRLQGLGGNTPGWTAALQAIPQHYKMSAWRRKLAEEEKRRAGLLPAVSTALRGTARVTGRTAQGVGDLVSQAGGGLADAVDRAQDVSPLHVPGTLLREASPLALRTARGAGSLALDTGRGLSEVAEAVYKDLHHTPPGKRIGLPKMLDEKMHKDKVATLKLCGFKGSEEKLSDIVKEVEAPSRLISTEMQKALNQRMIGAALGNSSAGEQTLGA